MQQNNIKMIKIKRWGFFYRNFIEKKFGSKFVEGRSLEFAKTFDEMTSQTPIFFILSPGVDPLIQVESLGDVKININIFSKWSLTFRKKIRIQCWARQFAYCFVRTRARDCGWKSPKNIRGIWTLGHFTKCPFSWSAWTI